MTFDDIENDLLVDLNKYGFMDKLFHLIYDKSKKDYENSSNPYPGFDEVHLIDMFTNSQLVGIIKDLKVSVKGPVFSWKPVKDYIVPNRVILFIEAPKNYDIYFLVELQESIMKEFNLDANDIIIDINVVDYLDSETIMVNGILLRKYAYEFIRIF